MCKKNNSTLKLKVLISMTNPNKWLFGILTRVIRPWTLCDKTLFLLSSKVAPFHQSLCVFLSQFIHSTKEMVISAALKLRKQSFLCSYAIWVALLLLLPYLNKSHKSRCYRKVNHYDCCKASPNDWSIIWMSFCNATDTSDTVLCLKKETIFLL